MGGHLPSEKKGMKRKMPKKTTKPVKKKNMKKKK